MGMEAYRCADVPRCSPLRGSASVRHGHCKPTDSAAACATKCDLRIPGPGLRPTAEEQRALQVPQFLTSFGGVLWLLL